MKTKYLFGMLLSGAMLAACTAEDDFNKVPVAQEVNPSAPVFTVHFDDNNYLNRAELQSNWQVAFKNGDLLSLFNGIKADNGSVATGQPKYSAFKSDYNAIYEGNSEGVDGFEFTTRSMVMAGGAILVWPADTIFQSVTDSGEEGTDNNIVLRITKDQNKESALKVPYMSEVLTIGDYVGDGKNQEAEAGYGHKYDIALKRVGSVLNLTMIPKNSLDEAIEKAGAAPMKFKSVELNGGADSEAFTTAIKVKATDEPSVARREKGAWGSNDPGAHLTWMNQSELDQENIVEAEDALVTEYIDGNMAVFTLLPSAKKTSGGSLVDDVKVADGAGKVIVSTNYGYITVADKEGSNPDQIWKNVSQDQKWSITEGIRNILSSKVLWSPTTVKNSIFYVTDTPDESENVGGRIQRNVEVDMKKLKMDGLHIENEQHLMDAIAVYHALDKDAANHITFILDGEKSGPNKGKFVMHKETWEAMIAELGTNSDPLTYSLTFAPCTVSTEACTTIQLINDGDELDVPNLEFVKDATEEGREQAPTNLNLELVGKWKFASTNKTETKHQLKGIKNLVVNGDEGKEGILQLTDYINAADATLTDLIVKKGGTVNVLENKTVYMEINMNNHGVVNVENKAVLSAGSKEKAADIVNREAQGSKATGWDQGGVINVKGLGSLQFAKGSTGNIYNYGVINQLSSLATVAITKNADVTDDVAVKAKFKNHDKLKESEKTVTDTKRIGTIYLKEATPTTTDGNYRVSISGSSYTATSYTQNTSYTGFVKVEVDSTYAPKEAFGTIANYVLLTGNCEGVRSSHTEMVNGQSTKVTDFSANIKFVEVNCNVDEVTFTGEDAFALRGIFVRKNNRAYVGVGAAVSVNQALFVNESGAKLLYSGTLTTDGAVYNGYFGGDASDEAKNVFEK